MATFVISNLNTINFNFEGIKFERLTFNTDIEKQWREQRNATFIAVADDSLKIKPIIHNDGLIGVVNDICLLLSIARSSYVYCSLYTNNETLILGGTKPIRDIRGKPMVSQGKIESFLDTAALTLRKLRWADRTGFVSSAHFLRGANCSEFDDDSFILCWIALETLANAHAEENRISTILPKSKFNKIVKSTIVNALDEINEEDLSEKEKVLIKSKIAELNSPSIRNKVYQLKDWYKWDFITYDLFDECNKLRNHIMHSGNYAGFNEHELTNITTRFRDAIQLVLIDLLGCSEFVPNLQGLKISIKGN